MRRFASTLVAAAIGLSPVTGVLAAEGDTTMGNTSNPSSMNLSIDFLSLTDFSANPTQDNWTSVVQQLRAHPCFHIVGEEAAWCENRYGLTADIETMLRRTDFIAWLRNKMIDSVCGGQLGTNRAACLAGFPMITSADMTRFQQQLTGNASVQVDATSSNEALFERAGTAPTTRRHALSVIDMKQKETVRLGAHERSAMLWSACEGSSMGQNGCFHSFRRYINDHTLDIGSVRGVIDRGGRDAQENESDDGTGEKNNKRANSRTNSNDKDMDNDK